MPEEKANVSKNSSSKKSLDGLGKLKPDIIRSLDGLNKLRPDIIQSQTESNQAQSNNDNTQNTNPKK